MGGLSVRAHGVAAGWHRGVACALMLAVAFPVGAAPLAPKCPDARAAAFSCRIDSRVLTICGLGGKAVLRVGKRSRMVVQARGARYASRMYSGGGEAQVIFASRASRFVVYDRTLRTSFAEDGANDAQAMTGMFVQKAGRTVSKLGCDPESLTGTLMPAGVVPAGQFVAH